MGWEEDKEERRKKARDHFLSELKTLDSKYTLGNDIAYEGFDGWIEVQMHHRSRESAYELHFWPRGNNKRRWFKNPKAMHKVVLEFVQASTKAKKDEEQQSKARTQTEAWVKETYPGVPYEVDSEHIVRVKFPTGLVIKVRGYWDYDNNKAGFEEKRDGYTYLKPYNFELKALKWDYPTMIEGILKHKELLPLLMNIHPDLDRMIAQELKKS